MPTLPIAATISMNAVPALSFDLGTTIGALEIGILVALFLSGMATVQVILYFQRHWHDSRGLKFAVRELK
jgi:hypothetical protein